MLQTHFYQTLMTVTSTTHVCKTFLTVHPATLLCQINDDCALYNSRGWKINDDFSYSTTLGVKLWTTLNSATLVCQINQPQWLTTLLLFNADCCRLYNTPVSNKWQPSILQYSFLQTAKIDNSTTHLFNVEDWPFTALVKCWWRHDHSTTFLLNVNSWHSTIVEQLLNAGDRPFYNSC